MAHLLIHSLRQRLAPGCLPLFTSDGLNVYFYALTAHFGDWRQMSCRGRQGRQWQVAAEPIYGQVQKIYQRRKLVRVKHVMRLGTQTALQVILLGLGFSGRLNTAFIERVNLTVRHGIAAASASHLGDCEAFPIPARPSGVVAHLLPFCAFPPIPPSSAHAAARTRWQAASSTLSTAYTSHGRQQNPSPMDSMRGALLPLAAAFRLSGLEASVAARSCQGEMGEGAGSSTRLEPLSRIRWPVRTDHGRKTA